MYINELIDYSVFSDNQEVGLTISYFSLSRGDACCIHTDSFDNAHLFLKALATLVPPFNGTYRFKEQKLDFSDYRSLLPIKKNIGYIAPDTALLSNRTVEENLLLTRYYYENALDLSLDEKTMDMCNQFGIENKLNFRPADLDVTDLRAAITIRELNKSLDLLLLERPEDFVGHSKFNFFIENVEKILQTGVPVVFFSNDDMFINRFSNRTVIIRNMRITTDNFDINNQDTSHAD